MTKSELEKKPLSELHTLAAEAGVERYRMLPRTELIAKLADGGSGNGPAGAAPTSGRGGSSSAGSEQRERPARRRRSRKPAGERGEDRERRPPRESSERRPEREAKPAPKPEPGPEPKAASAPAADASESPARPRRRRRRRFGRRGKQGVTLQGLLLPPESRQALLAAETREACTTLLRGIAADLSEDSNGGPDPVALLIDPSPEELADWRRDAPRAEIVAAGQPRHADDALAQAVARASKGDHVMLLVDSLTRLGEAYDDADAAKKFFDAGRGTSGSGSLTVVAALERPASN